MKRSMTFVAALFLVLLGWNHSPDHPRAEEPQKKKESLPMVKESAWTWGYFFASADKAAVQKIAGDRKQSLSLYKIESVVSIRGKPGIDAKPGATIVRLEIAAKLGPVAGAQAPALLFRGVPQHLQYTSREQRDDLNKRSRTELPASKNTVAVIIPIRKSAAWWALPHDERHAHFQKKGDKIGHTAIGAKYVERIYRKLYHARYAVEAADHDFITYFEFERAHTDDFKSLLKQLRDPEQNPEWNFVDREYEIWTTKIE
jgi:hypothetical protein